MKSVKRIGLHNNDIYKIIRRFYSFHFPYPVEFSAIDAINLTLQEKGGTLGAPGKFELDPKGIILFVIESTSSQSNNKFKKPSDCHELVDDVETLHKWLVKHEFIDDEVPTPKFISTTDLIF